MPNRISTYELVERIASGGMAEIFLARRTGPEGFEKSVAIKRLLPHLAADPTLTAMFLDEARLAARLNHPKVVQIYDLGEEDGSFFTAMEYLVGEDLRAVLAACAARGIAVSESVVARIGADVAEGLHYAHTATDARGRSLNVIHRDVGPRNIFLTWQGYVKLVDFGIAKAADRVVQTMDGYLRGKLAYMAPEQLARADIDCRVDVWSLGVTLFEMVAGCRPTAGLSRAQAIQAISEGDLPPLRSRAPQASEELERIVNRALEPDRSRRFQTAGEMQERLEGLLAAGGETATAHDVAALLERCFGAEHFQRQLQRHSRAPTPREHMPVAPTGATPTLPDPAPTGATPTVPDPAPTGATPTVPDTAPTLAAPAVPIDEAPAAPAMGVEPVELPRRFGEYLLLEAINTGGMAEVFRAKAFGVEGFERLVAIKRILPHLAEDDTFVRMFVDEAHIAVQLTNANIVQVYELGEVDGQYYIVMEYVNGLDLKHVLRHLGDRDEPLPLPHATFVASCVCSALDYAHRKHDLNGEPLNIVHRDVSPHNVLVGFDGAAKLTDFGIAKAKHRVAKKTKMGMLKGKLAYMSPEQSKGAELDRRSDIFGVGVLLWEMLTGEPAFAGASHFEILEQLRHFDVPPPSTRRPEVPPELDRIVLKAMARNRNDRYPWASDLADDLQLVSLDAGATLTSQKMATFMRSRFAEAFDDEKVRTEGFRALAPTRLRGRPSASPKVKVIASRSLAAIPREEPAEPAPRGGRWMTVGSPHDVTDPAGVIDADATLAPVDELADTVPAPSPVFAGERRAKRSAGLRLWIMAAFGALLAGAFLATLLLGSTPEPRPEPTPERTVGSAVAIENPNVSGAEREQPDGESYEDVPEEPADDRPPPRAHPVMRELHAAMKKRGILAGDDARLDDARTGLIDQLEEDRARDAQAALPEALELVAAIEVDARFVAAKLRRFHRRFERLRDAEFKAEVQPLVDEAMALLVGGEPESANQQLNRAIIMCRKWAAR